MVEKAPQQPSIDKEEKEILPFQRMYPIIDLYRKAPDKGKFMLAMKKGGISVNGENITPIDFFATSADLSDEEILEAIEGYLEVENIEDNLELINDSLEKARDFMVNYLHVGVPREIKNLDEIKNLNDILKIFKKTTVLKKGDKIGYGAHYCLLVSSFAAAFEFKKGELEGLIKESEYIYDEMKDKNEKGIYHFSKLEEREGYDMVAIYDGVNRGTIMAEAYFRGKSEYSFMAKLLNKPEATAKEAAKDAIGIKLEIEDINELRRVACFLEGYMKEKFNAFDLVFENTALFNKDDEIYEKIKGIKESKNPHTNPNFQSFKINGRLQLPKNGDRSEDAMIIPDRQFEIQIVLTDNKNESGFSQHSIYEASKKLAIFTRVVGSITEEYLDIICREASRRSGISARKIKNRFLKTVLSGFDIKKDPRKIKRFGHERHAERQEKTNIYPDSVKIRKKGSKN